jgi:hypothetical protein
MFEESQRIGVPLMGTQVFEETLKNFCSDFAEAFADKNFFNTEMRFQNSFLSNV